jgi:hypothetical protein
MVLLTYDREGARRLGAWVEDAVVDLPDAVGHPVFPVTMERLVARNGGTTLAAAEAALHHPGVAKEFAVPDARLLVPFLPSFSGPDLPIVLGPDDRLPWKPVHGRLAVAPQLACIVGRAGTNVPRERAARAMFGYSPMVVWSCYRAGRGEIRAVAIGPLVATPDGFDPEGVGVDLHVDGRVRWSGRIEATRETFVDMVVEASRTGIRAGQIIGAGASPEWPGIGGSGGRIGVGSVVEVEVEGLGILRTGIGVESPPVPRPAKPPNQR